MVETRYVVTMAAYNRWQNENLYGAAGTLSDADRKADRGAFFGSIHATLNHLLWADEVWMGRLADRPHPAIPMARSHARYEDWDALRAARVDLDADIVAWASTLEPAWLARSPARKAGVPRTHGFLVMHVFNHQTHHRGQVHAMLTAAGARPGDTDLLKLET